MQPNTVVSAQSVCHLCVTEGPYCVSHGKQRFCARLSVVPHFPRLQPPPLHPRSIAIWLLSFMLLQSTKSNDKTSKVWGTQRPAEHMNKQQLLLLQQTPKRGVSSANRCSEWKKTCHIWNIDVTSRPLARGCCADVTQRGASLFSELSTGKENVPANYCTEHWLRHNTTQNHDDNSRTNWLLCPLPEHNVGPDTAGFKLIYNGTM